MVERLIGQKVTFRTRKAEIANHMAVRLKSYIQLQHEKGLSPLWYVQLECSTRS